MSLIENQFNSSSKVIQTNNGNKFANNQYVVFFSNKGIIHQTTCPYTPHQNGIVERKHRHLLEVARALKIQSSLTDIYWGDCVLTSCYIINRLPTTSLSFETPYERLYYKVPSLSHFRTFDCLCFGKKIIPQHKFMSRYVKSVFMGYSSTQKGYKFFNLQTRQMYISRDVIFC